MKALRWLLGPLTHCTGAHRRSIKDFVLVKEVGSGAASTVYYAICRKSTLPVAIKMYLKAKLSKLNRKQVREVPLPPGERPHGAPGWVALPLSKDVHHAPGGGGRGGRRGARLCVPSTQLALTHYQP